MPISVIENKIDTNLANIDFARPDIKYKPALNLKRSILEDTNVSIKIVEKNKFFIYIRFIDFHEILVNNFYYNNRRLKLQLEELDKLKESPSIAWFLITMYYAAFFASNEIANLAGYYNFNFDTQEKNILFNKNELNRDNIALEFKTSEVKNFFGELSLCDEPNTVKITCVNGGGKPHELSWQTLSKLLKNPDSNNEDVVARTIRLQKILLNKKNWKKPNTIRNEWNYSRAELYNHNIDDSKFVSKYFNKYSQLKRWAEARKEYPNHHEDDIISIMYIINILQKIMNKYEEKLIL